MDISIIFALIIEAKEINDPFEKICRKMYGKKKANIHYYHAEGSSNSNGIMV